MNYIEKILNDFEDDFGPRPMNQGPRNMYNQGQLVQPNADGSRPGYSGSDKYITPSRRSGAEGFQGQKFISVKDSSYSDGRKRVKTPQYEKYLKEEIKKSKQRPDAYAKGNTRRQPGLLRIAEAMQQADIYDDPEYMMPNKEAMKAREKDFGRKQKIYKNGMLQAGDIVYINGLEKNFDDVIFIADQLGEDPDWVLDQLDERINFRDFEKDKKDVYKKDPKYTKPRNDYLKVENWVQRNAKKYSNPDTFENALIKRFGRDNQFVKDMNSNKGRVTSYFSDDFKKMMFNANPRTQIIPSHLKQFIKSSLYNFNPKIKNAVTEEIKGIFNSENLPKLRLEARNLLNNNKLLAKFGINKAITGPFAKVIQAEIGTDMWNDISNFRNPRVGTSEMLSTLKNLVDPEFKPMFEETIKAINFSKKNQWQKAKDVFGLADDIMWDHKVPSSIIDKGYADRIESIKVNPTSKDFNARIKNAGFDRPINKLITKFEKATTLDAKAKIKNEMDIVKNNFSQKYGGYLDEVSIDLDKKGNLKFSSSANPLTTKDDRVAMLGKSMVQEGRISRTEEKRLRDAINDAVGELACGDKLAGGGRIKFNSGSSCNVRGRKILTDAMKNGINSIEPSKQNLVKRILSGSANLVRGVLDPKEFFKLKNLIGFPAAVSAAVFDTAMVADDMIRKGQPFDEAAGNELLFGQLNLQPKIQEAKRVLADPKSSLSPAAKKYAEMLVDIGEYNNTLQTKNIPMKVAGMPGDPKEQEMLQKKLDTLDKKISSTSTSGELDYLKEITERDVQDKSGRYIGEPISSKGGPMYARDGDGNLIKVNEYGYGRTGLKDFFGDAPDKTGAPSFFSGELKKSYGDLKQESGKLPEYDINMIPAYVSQNYKTMDEQPLSKGVIDLLTKYERKKGTIGADQNLDDVYFINERFIEGPDGVSRKQKIKGLSPLEEYKLQNKFEQVLSQPGMKGTQFSEGGITTLRSKYEYKK